MDNDILGNLPSGVLSWWKPSQYRETYSNKTLTLFFMCPQGEGRGLVPKIHSTEYGLPLTEISIETHESNKVDLITLTCSKDRDEDDDDPDNPDGLRH